MKLNLGCGRKKMHGFVNIDIRPEVEPDRVDDVYTLETIGPHSARLIYACHVLEHARRLAVPDILRRWREILVPGGMLRVCVPDLEKACEYYMTHRQLKDIHGLLYGGQRNDWDLHRTGFDFESLEKTLSDAGYVAIHRYDWRMTEHSFVDDYSQSYLPGIAYKTRNPAEGEIQGLLMSLNVEATAA